MFIITGKAFDTMDSRVFDRFPGYETNYPWWFVWIQSLGMWLFPQLELLVTYGIAIYWADPADSDFRDWHPIWMAMSGIVERLLVGVFYTVPILSLPGAV